MASQSPCHLPIELTGADAADVASLYSRCADYFLLQDGAVPTMADAHELFTDVPPERDARDQTVLGWKGEDGIYAIAAILRNYPHDGAWYLGFMIVDAVQRGRGVGRSIYSKIEDWAAARGATEIRLAVLEANEAGERFWRSLGFSEVRRVGPDTFKMRTHRRIELNRSLNGGFAAGNPQ
ncbi:GNAT family N-acetyltransferase (plasmid) [Polymorphobacter megasporae]|nr:GNAT family N-acetyltransferase [Polymorphobacter megasporae]